MTPNASSTTAIVMNPAATDDWWSEYPLNSASYEPSRYNGVEIRDLLASADTKCFSKETDHLPISLRVIDLNGSEAEGQKLYDEHLCKTSQQVEDVLHLSATDDATAPVVKKPRVRIISIHSRKTIGPLQITAPLMRKLLAKYDVAPEFVQVLLLFARNADLAENGNCDVYVQSGENGSKKLLYELSYMELSGREPGDLVGRHTGVYHAHSQDLDLFILLQCKGQTAAEQRIRDLNSPEPRIREELSKLCENPFRLHMLLASSYIHNWRPYLGALVRDFNSRSDPAMVLPPGGEETGAINFGHVQELRHIQDQVISAKMNCKSGLRVLTDLNALDVEGLNGIPFQMRLLEGFIESAEELSGRVRNTIDLIGFTLDRNVQIETVKVYKRLSEHTAQVRDLTKDSLKNNTTVTLITFVSAFYLPGGFIASLFGMNFVVVNTSANRIQVTNDFWIFFLAWILLSMATFGVYLVVSKREERKQKAEMMKEASTFHLVSSTEKGS